MKDEFLKRLERVAELLLDNGADATITDRVSLTKLYYSLDIYNYCNHIILNNIICSIVKHL